MAGYIYAVKIEGVGDSGGTYRYTWGRDLLDDAATADPNDLYQTGLLRWPQQISFGVNFQNSTARLGSASFALRRNEKVIGTQAYSVPKTFYSLRRFVKARFVGPAVSPTDTFITLDTSGLIASVPSNVLIWGREAISLVAEGPAFTYQVTRGALGTTATAHGAGIGDDKELFDIHSAATLASRRVDMVRIPLSSTGYADEEVRWTGVLRTITSPDPGQIVLEADNALSMVKTRELMTQQWRGHILPGGVTEREIVCAGQQTEENYLPDGGTLPDKPFIIGFKDAAYVVRRSPDISLGIASVRYLGDAQDVPFAGSPEFTEDRAPKERDEVWEIISSHEDQPPNAAAVAVNTLPLPRNPAILVLQLLTSTDNGGAPGPNGPYDTGIANLAGSVPVGLVDVDSILAWAEAVIGSRDRDDGDVQCLHIGLEGKPEKLHEVIQKVLAPYGSTMTQASGGLISIARISDSLETDEIATTIPQSKILNIPIQDRRVFTATDKVQSTYNDRPGVGPDRLNVLNGVRLNRVPEGQTNLISLDMGWIPLRETAVTLASSWISIWHEPLAAVQIKTNNTINLWPGDNCLLTHEKVYGADGSVGLVDGLFLVESRKETLTEDGHILDYTLLYVGSIYNTLPTGIAPNATIVSYNPAGPTITIETTDFVGPNGSPVGTLDVEGFAAGDKIKITDQYGALLDPLDDPTTILSVGALNTITLTAPLNTAPGAGDIMRVAAYGDAVTTQRSKWTFISDANNLLNGTDLPKEYRAQ